MSFRPEDLEEEYDDERDPFIVGHDDISAFRVGEPGQTEGWNFIFTLYAWLHGIALLTGIGGLLLGLILFRAWQRGEIGSGNGDANCTLGGDSNGPCLNNSLFLINPLTPGLCGSDEVLTNAEYDDKGRTIGGECRPRDPIVNSLNITCGPGEVLQGPFTLIQSGRIVQFGAICVPLLQQVRNTSLNCAVAGQVLTSPFVFDIYGRLTGGTCTTPLGNGTLPDINNGTQTCPPGLFIVGSVVTGSGLLAGPFACISNASSGGGAINPGNLTCPPGYYMNFTLLSDGRGFAGTCIELRLFGDVEGPMNATTITPVRSLITCGILKALAGATYLATGQVTGGSCVSVVSNNTLPVINNTTNCSGVDEYALSKVVTDTGLSFHPVCVNVTGGGGSFTSLVDTANQTQVINLGGGNWRVGTIQPNDPQADVRWGKARIGANTAFATQGPSGGLKLMSFDANPANGNNLAFYRTDQSAFPIAQVLNNGPQTFTLQANHFFDGTNYRSTYAGMSYPAFSMGNVAGSFVASPNGYIFGFLPPAVAPNTILGSFQETVLLTPLLSEFYTPTNVKTPLGLLSIYNSILGPQPQIQTAIFGAGNSWLSFGSYLTSGGVALSSGNVDNFKWYHFGSSLFLQRKLATAAGTPVSATTTNIAEFNANGMGMFATGVFNPGASLFLAPINAGNSIFLFDGYMDSGNVRASFASTPIFGLQKTPNELNLIYSDGGAATSAPPLFTILKAGGTPSGLPTHWFEFDASVMLRPPSGFGTSNFSMYESIIPSAAQINMVTGSSGAFAGIMFNSYLSATNVEVSSNGALLAGEIMKISNAIHIRLQPANVPLHAPLNAWNDEVVIRTTETTFRLPPAVASYSTTPQIIVSDPTRHLVQSGITTSQINGFYFSASISGQVCWSGGDCAGGGTLCLSPDVAMQVNWQGYTVTYHFGGPPGLLIVPCTGDPSTSIAWTATLPVAVPFPPSHTCITAQGTGPAGAGLTYRMCFTAAGGFTMIPYSLVTNSELGFSTIQGTQYQFPLGYFLTYVTPVLPP